MDCSSSVFSVHGILQQEYWSGLPFPSPGDLPNPGIEPRSPTLQADTLPSEPPGKQPTREATAMRGLSKEEPLSLQLEKAHSTAMTQCSQQFKNKYIKPF